MFELLKPVGAQDSDTLRAIATGAIPHRGIQSIGGHLVKDTGGETINGAPGVGLGPAPRLWRRWLERLDERRAAPRIDPVSGSGRAIRAGDSEYWRCAKARGATTRPEKGSELTAWGVVLPAATDVFGMSARRLWVWTEAGAWVLDPVVASAHERARARSTEHWPRIEQGPEFLLQVIGRCLAAYRPGQPGGIKLATTDALVALFSLPLLAATTIAGGAQGVDKGRAWETYIGFFALHVRMQAVLLLHARGDWTGELEGCLLGAQGNCSFKEKLPSKLAAMSSSERTRYLHDSFTKDLSEGLLMEVNGRASRKYRERWPEGDRSPRFEESFADDVWRHWTTDGPPEQGRATSRRNPPQGRRPS